MQENDGEEQILEDLLTGVLKKFLEKFLKTVVEKEYKPYSKVCLIEINEQMHE